MPAFLITRLSLPQSAAVVSFEGDYYGKRCVSGKRSGDVFNDFLDILDGVSFAETTVKWKLHNYASVSDYELWESHIHQGLQRCVLMSSWMVLHGWHLLFDVWMKRYTTGGTRRCV
jgi:hypothetical protein